MISKPLVTVVLPIYNVEEYLEKSILSVVDQTYKNLEIILIDDGSKDLSGKICEEWKQKDSRIKVIHKKNEGLGKARNTGIVYSTGKYILFLDSDDYYQTTLIETSIKEIISKKADFVLFGFCDVTDDGKIIKEYIPSPSKNILEKEDINELLIKHLYSYGKYNNEEWNVKISAWNCVFSSDTIRGSNFEFVSERKIISEDTYSMLNYYVHINKTVIIPKRLYFHRINNKSLSHTFREDRIDKLNYFYNELKILCKSLKLDSETIALMANPYVSGMINAMKMIAHCDMPILSKIRNYKIILNCIEFVEAVDVLLNGISTGKKKVLLLLLKSKNALLCLLVFKLID